ncbi:MAG: sulfatase-like hydrolase/transferase [Chlorobi bacterium]|nr:sulfatase-like hydrolase/transferase [Chlorobiota bacterium]
MKRALFLLFITLISMQTYSQKKNVLFIAVDDLKPLIGAFGDTYAITPNIDKLAEEGYMFENAYTQQAVCAPSRASMLTGLRPDRTKVWDLKTKIRSKNPQVVTLPQVFKKNGYTTYAIGKIFDPRSVDKGHDARSWTIPYISPDKLPGPGPKPALGYYLSEKNLDKIKFYEGLAQAKGLKGGARYKFIASNFKPSTEMADVPDEAYIDGRITTEALKKLDKFANEDKPFMLMVGYKRPHLPFVAPTKYWNLYKRNEVPVAKYQKHSKGGPALAYHNNPELKSYTDIPDAIDEYGDLNIEKQRELIHGYYAATSYIDALIGRLMDKLKATGLDKNTIIVLWGDHGFHLGDHGLWTKHTNFEQATHLPLLIVDPGYKPGKTDIPVETLDIYPTLCELTGVKPPKDIQGQSLVPYLKGGSVKQTFAVSQWPSRGYKGGMGYTIRTKRYRYTEWYKAYRSTMPRNEKNLVATELYDYETDPLETKNLVKNKKYAEVLKQHQKLLHDFLDKQVIKNSGMATGVLTVTANEIPAQPKGTPIRDIVEKNFKPGSVYIGCTVSQQDIPSAKTKLLARQFSYTTPANAVKQHAVHPTPDKWDWSKIDKVIKFADKNNMVVRLHGPVSPQCSPWAKDDNRKPDELLKNMTEYMTAECEYFRGKSNVVKWMDVVNETVAQGGEWFGPKPGTDQWENPWLQIGLNDDGIPIYIVKAFEIATEKADPDIKLVYNQHLTMEPAVWEKVKSTILYLKKKGLRVDAIGWQAHLKERDNVGLDPDALKYLSDLIDWTHKNGMEFHVTEIDYKMDGTYDDIAAQKQAIAYSNVLKVLLSKRNQGVVAYNIWGLADGQGKYSNGHRYIFDEELRAKPAFYAIQKTLENPDDLKLIFDIPKPDISASNASFDSGIIKNGGFEDDLNGWLNWADSEVDFSGNQHSGEAALALRPKSGIKQNVKLKPNTNYVLTVWVKNEEGDHTSIKLKIDGVDKPLTRGSTSNQYTMLTINFNSGKSHGATVFAQKWKPSDKGTSWVDDFSLKEVK